MRLLRIVAKAKGRDSTLARHLAAATVNAAPGPLTFEVIGRPVPKGSATAFAFADKVTGKPRAVVTQGKGKQRSALAEYAANIREEAYRAIGRSGRGRELDGGPRFVGHALSVELEFRLARPRKHFRTGKQSHLLRDDAPAHPSEQPDIDKLARATLDALTATVFDDDKRVARLVCDKVYADLEGVRIRVAALCALEIPVPVPPSSPPTVLERAKSDALAINARAAKLRAAAGPKFAADRAMLADELDDHVCSKHATEPCAGCHALGAPVAVPTLTSNGIVDIDPTLDESDFG